jgi:hypothetical protein
MSRKVDAEYENLTSEEEKTKRPGGRGRDLLSLKDPIIWPLIVISTFAIVSIGVVGWVADGPSLSAGHKVLRTGSLKVDQFYSGLVLGLVLAPAGITVRKIAHDLALLQPFLVSSRKPVSLADMDLLMDPGILAMKALSKYSAVSAIVQTLLLFAGAFLVPIGTLMVTTGNYEDPSIGTAVIGIPSVDSSMMTLSIEMGMGGFCTNVTNCHPLMDDIDTVLMNTVRLFEGDVIRQTGMLSNTTMERLGPIPTSNITLQEGVTYAGIVTYSWSSGCEYTTEISYVETEGDDSWNVNFTFPDGSVQGDDVWTGWMCMWSDSKTQVNTSDTTQIGTNSVPIGGNTYIAVAATIGASTPIHDPQSQGVVLAGGTWISRVKCAPTLDWEVSTCTWRNGTWTDCSASPGQNTTALDNQGLENLKYYMTATPFYLNSEPTYVLDRPSLLTALIFDPTESDFHVSRVPSLADYDRMYGVVASSLASTTLGGFYGTAEVPTTGSAPKPVYVVRTYILGIVVFVLLTVPLLTTLNLVFSLLRRLPLRRATFLTIANAVRGPWWDGIIWGGCTLSPHVWD